MVPTRQLYLTPDVERRVRAIATADYDVLITGPTGAGKSAVAQRIHELSARRGKRFVAQNCGAIPADLAESTLFGHMKGAFSGAHEAARGIVSEADQGTLFLDEIGELPLPVQAKLLTLLQDRVYRAVGSVEDRSSRFRLIAATNRDLLEQCNQGRFREDLYHRLNVLTLTLPALREMPGEAHRIAAEAVKRLEMPEKLGAAVLAAVAELSRHPLAWRGNVRELLHFVDRCRHGVEAATHHILAEWPRWRTPESAERLTPIAPVSRGSLAEREGFARLIHAVGMRGARPKSASSRRGSHALAARLLDAFPEPLSLDEVQAALDARDPRTAKANIAMLIEHGLVEEAKGGIVAVWPPVTSMLFVRRDGQWLPIGSGEIRALAAGERLRVTLTSKLAGTLGVLLVTHRQGSPPQPKVLVTGWPLVPAKPKSLEFDLDTKAGLEQLLLHIGLPAHRGGTLVGEPYDDEGALPEPLALDEGRRMALARWGEGWLAEHLVFHTEAP